MRPLTAVLHLFSSMLFLIAGAIFLGLFAIDPARLKLLHLLEIEPKLFVVAGAFAMTLGILLLLGFYWAHRGKFLVVRMGEREVAVDAKVVASTLRPRFHKQFGRRLDLLSVEIGAKGVLEIALHLAPQMDAEQTLTLLESDLQTLFAERFGYKKPFKIVLANP